MTSPQGSPSAAVAATALQPGALFAGRYKIVRAIAAGGMGAVYEVEHAETGRHRALKVMHPHLFDSEEMRDRFKREARIASQVESEYIVDVSDAGVDETTRMPFMVMELLRGEELGDLLKRVGRLSSNDVVTYLSQAAMALDRTHARSIIHRDLKPQNLFITQREDGTPRIKILDFGVAKIVAEGATGAGATRSLGTPLYMAPEQLRTNVKLTPAADIHALGMMVFTLLVGQPYWTPEANGAGDVIAFAMAVVRGPQEAATARAMALGGVALPPAFDAWFAKVTAQNPADRFATATEAIRALGQALGVGPGARPAEPLLPVAAPILMAPTAALPVQITPPSGVGSGTPVPVYSPPPPQQPISGGYGGITPSAPLSPPLGVAGGATDSTGSTDTLSSARQSASGGSSGKVVAAVGAVVVLAGAAIAVYLAKGSAVSPSASSVSEVPSTVQTTEKPTTVQPAGPADRVVKVAVEPPGATVEVDGKTATLVDGNVEVRGAPGSVHPVTLHKDGRSVSVDVAILETGPSPAKVSLPASAAPTATPSTPVKPGVAATAPPSAAKTEKPASTSPPATTSTATKTSSATSTADRTF